MAPTALGLQIRNLEEELGVDLLERHARGVTVTAAGATMNLHAGEILQRIETAKSAVRARAGQGVSTVRLGITHSVSRMLGPELQREFEALLPGVELVLTQDTSLNLASQMARGYLSCALCYAQDTLRGVTRRALLEEELLLLTTGAEPAPDGPASFREIARLDLALTATHGVVTQTLVEIAERLGVGLNVAYELQSLAAVKALVAKGAAATVMPYGAAEEEIRTGVFRARPTVLPPVVRTLALLLPEDRAESGLGSELDLFADRIADRLHAIEGPVTRRL